MKKVFFLLSLMLLTTTLSVSAQRQNRNNDNRKARTEQMAKRMAEQMKLDDNAKAKFIPLYTEMQDTLAALRADLRPAQREKDAKKMTTEEALRQLDARFTATEREVAVKRRYAEAMKSILTPQQLLRTFSGFSQMRNFTPGTNGANGARRGGFGGQGGNFGGGQGGFPDSDF